MIRRCKVRQLSRSSTFTIEKSCEPLGDFGWGPQPGHSYRTFELALNIARALATEDPEGRFRVVRSDSRRDVVAEDSRS